MTIGATGQGMVAGDLVNTASRLQSARHPGTVLVGEATIPRRHRRHLLRAGRRADAQGKGGARPGLARDRAWSRGAADAAAPAALEPPFVGRDDELRLLKELFDATAREQQVAAGDGGRPGRHRQEPARLGVREVPRRRRRHGLVARGPFAVPTARGSATGRWPRWSAARAGSPRATTTRDRPSAGWRSAGGLPGRPASVAGSSRALAGLLGLGRCRRGHATSSSPPGERSSSGLPTRARRCMVFEDLQWADQGLLDFIEDLLRLGAQRPIFVIALARPELLERRPGWGTALRKLTPDEPRAARSSTDGGAARGLGARHARSAHVRAIVGRAEGIPLYAVETMRMLLDRRDARRRTVDRYRRGDLERARRWPRRCRR